jgi:hypothetical protein
MLAAFSEQPTIVLKKLLISEKEIFVSEDYYNFQTRKRLFGFFTSSSSSSSVTSDFVLRITNMKSLTLS